MKRFWYSVVIGIVLLTLFELVYVPRHSHGGPSKTSRIHDNLMQLEGAKEQWALDHSKTGALALTWEDIGPYFRRQADDALIVPVAGERYTLGNLDQSPEAVLTRDLDGRPKGTVLRLGTPVTHFETILPNDRK